MKKYFFILILSFSLHAMEDETSGQVSQEVRVLSSRPPEDMAFALRQIDYLFGRSQNNSNSEELRDHVNEEQQVSVDSRARKRCISTDTVECIQNIGSVVLLAGCIGLYFYIYELLDAAITN